MNEGETTERSRTSAGMQRDSIHLEAEASACGLGAFAAPAAASEEIAPRTGGFRRAMRDVVGRASALASLAVRAGWAHVRAAGTAPGALADRWLMRHVREEWRDLNALLAHIRVKPAPALPLFGQAQLARPEPVNVEGGGGRHHHSGQQRETVSVNDDHQWEFFEALNRHYPQEAARVIADAERIRRGEYRLLNEHFNFPGEVNWHVDAVSGRIWPRQHVGWMGRWFWTAKRTSDVLPTWELNRHQHFVTLGRAYFLTGDERYAATCASQIRSWLAQNPPAIGVNWFSSLEIGMRLVSWSISFYLLRTSEAFADEMGKVFLKGLWRQARYLWRHLTLDQAVPNNHLIGEVAALVVVGGLFPEFKEAQTWVQTGMQILEEALHAQTHIDGVNKEQASGYHRFVLDLVLLVVLVGQCGFVPRSARLEQILEQMLDYALYAMNPEGHLPQFGDSGDGWGVRLDMGAAHRDVRPWLAVGAVLFRRADFKFGATTAPRPMSGMADGSTDRLRAEALWLLGAAGREIFLELENRLPAFRSFAFYEAGHYILRDSWEWNTDYAVMRSGEFGLGGEGACAHAHCDLLSVELWMRGRPILVDSGTYSYHGPWRDYFRLTSAHNTLRIDGEDQAVPLNAFAWSRVPEAARGYHGERAARGMLEIRGVSIERHLRHPAPGLWRLEDGVVDLPKVASPSDVGAPTSVETHTVEWRFHFAPDLDLYWDEVSGNWLVSENGRGMVRDGRRLPIVAIVVPVEVEVRAERGWTSPGYGHKERTMQLVATWSGKIPDDGLHVTWEFKQQV